jgi:hypothetical protein
VRLLKIDGEDDDDDGDDVYHNFVLQVLMAVCLENRHYCWACMQQELSSMQGALWT